MRVIPILTAVTVTAGLYMLVIEREALMAYARGEDGVAVEETAAPGTKVAQNNANDGLVGVVALRSEEREIDSAVVLRGQTQAIRQVEVRAETTAAVISDPLRKGANVKAGDVLCQLDPGTRHAALLEAQARLTEARARIPEAEANVAEARARLTEAEINANAARKLIEGGYASETRRAATEAAERAAMAGIAAAETGVETTRAGIEAAAAGVAAAQREIDRLTITAPFDGLLESDTAELGSLLQSGGLCATVIQLDTIKLVGYVPEAMVDRVKLGAAAGAELATGKRVQGIVTFISRSADPSTRTFEVDIAVPNPDLSIRDGQTADIMISADGAKAHRIPQSALTLNNEGQLGVRTVDATSTVGFYPVRLVRDTPEGVWITGLPEKADIIITGQDFVTAGVTVRPTFQEAGQ